MTVQYPMLVAWAAVCSLSLALALACHGFVWWTLRRRRRHRAALTQAAQKVSILKPLCGAEPQLRENLQGLAEQTVAPAQVLFAVASPTDPALAVAHAFARSNPHLNTGLNVGGDPSIVNPKVALLERIAQGAVGDWLVVSDSNVRIAPDYVQRALATARPDVGLVTHLVAGSGENTLAGALETLQLNCLIAPGLCGARYLGGRTCVVGKSMFLRAETLKAIGGFRSAGAFLAEDYHLGQAVERAGYRVAIADKPVRTNHPGWRMRHFFSRHFRWSAMRRKTSRLGYCLEVLLNPGPLFLVLIALATTQEESPLNFRYAVAGYTAAQLLAVATSVCLSGWNQLPKALLINPLRELLSIAIWIGGLWTCQIQWRGKTYWIGPQTRLVEEPSAAARELGDEA